MFGGVIAQNDGLYYFKHLDNNSSDKIFSQKKIRRTKFLVGKNFRHQAEIS